MKSKFLFLAILFAAFSTPVFGQGDDDDHEHSDIELGYDNLEMPSAFVIEGDDMTLDNIQYFEAEVLNTLGDLNSPNPGFVTNHEEDLLVNIGDEFWLSALDAGDSANSSYGVGYVNYYNPLNDTFTDAGEITIVDNDDNTGDLILNSAFNGMTNNLQFIDTATDSGDPSYDGGDIHDHVTMDLDDSAPVGAYGVLFELHSDFGGNGSIDLTSDKFWIVWNNGMDEEDFDTMALPKFGVSAVPEPGTASLLAIGVATVLLRRRRKV